MEPADPSFKRAQSGNNYYGIANCSQQDDGHTVVLMDHPWPSHLEVLLDHVLAATARRPYVGTCLAKNSLLPALGNPFHLGARVAS
jgi:hypothetical protein